MSDRPGVRIGRAVDRTRIAAEIAFAVIIAFGILLAAAWISFAEGAEADYRVLIMPLVLLAVLVVDVVRAMRQHRAAAPGALRPSALPGRDALWDRRDAAAPTWRGARADTAVTLGTATRGRALQEAVVSALGAVRLAGEPATRVRHAVESAAAALGVAQAPAVYVAPGAGVNAVVAGSPESSSMVFSVAMLTSFSDAELLGVAAGLLARVRRGAAESLRGAIDADPSWVPAAKMTPTLVLDIYRAADVDAALALHDPSPVVGALTKTAAGDPYLPGLTTDQAQLMWTWPSAAAPWQPETPGDVVQGMLDSVLKPEEPLSPRVEVLRMQALTRAGVRPEDLSTPGDGSGPLDR